MCPHIFSNNSEEFILNLHTSVSFAVSSKNKKLRANPGSMVCINNVNKCEQWNIDLNSISDLFILCVPNFK